MGRVGRGQQRLHGVVELAAEVKRHPQADLSRGEFGYRNVAF